MSKKSLLFGIRSIMRRGIPAAVFSGVVLGSCGTGGRDLATAAEPPMISEPAALPGAEQHPDNSSLEMSLGDLLGDEVAPIDLAAALDLAGVQNPEILIARQRVVQAVAERQLAAAQLLPSIRAGLSYDDHTGPLQQSFGNILSLHRSSMYIGAGAFAIAAGTVNIPGVYWNANLSQLLIDNLRAMNNVEQQRFHNRAVENQVLLRVAVAYNNLLRSAGMRAVMRQNLDDAREVVRLTEAYARAGGARQADADRARGTANQYKARWQSSEGQLLISSAGLAEVLNLDPSVRLQPLEEYYVPMPLIPDPIPLRELVAIAAVQRPELQEGQSAIRQSLLALRGARMLPFSPNVIIGFSAGGEGGGSNLVNQPAGSMPFARSDPRFGNWSGRSDFDVVSYWMLKNLGVGNLADIRAAESQLHVSNFELLAKLDTVRAEVARSHARSLARLAQISTAEEAIRTATEGFDQDKQRIQGGQGLPIELLDDLRLLVRVREEYLRTIIDYNQAQLELYVALGHPPADMLARPIQGEGGPPAPADPGGVPAPAPAPR